MNKAQRNCIAEHLSVILRRMERLENRIYSAREIGNDEKVASISARIEELSAEMRGADAVLTMVGYVRHYHDDEDGGHYTIEKM